MAKDPKDQSTLDLEHNRTDRAIRALRDYQTGKATTGFMRSQLAAEGVDMLAVSLGTRVPVSMLEKLKAGS